LSPGFIFGAHCIAASGHPMRRAGIALSDRYNFPRGDYGFCRALRGGFFQLHTQLVREVIH